MITLEAIVIIITVTTVLASIPSLPSTPVVTGEEFDSSQLNLVFLTINLAAGQTATGSFNFNGGDGTTGFQVYDPTNGLILASVTNEYRGDFMISAYYDGSYRFLVAANEDFENITYVLYEYSKSSNIFGLNPIVFIASVTTTGVILTLVIAFSFYYLTRTRNKNTPH